MSANMRSDRCPHPNRRRLQSAIGVAAALLAVSPAAAQNLLANPGFDQNLAGWTIGSFHPQRVALDANGSAKSGSARVTVPGGPSQGVWVLRQCVPAAAAATYDLSAKVQVQESGRQVGGLRFHAGANCEGVSLTADSFHASGPAAAWQTAHRRFTAPGGAHSALVELIATTRSPTGTAHTVRWDDVYFGPAAPASCTANANTLCLDRLPGDQRFLVLSRFATAQSGGLSGPGNAISLANLGVGRGGLFWFFSASNPEMLVKVLDGCPDTGFFWVFVSAGTNVGVELYVADTVTGAVALFHNPDLGPYPAIQNLLALPCL